MEMKITHEEIIKPEAPIDSHLQTYHLSLLDQLDGSIYAPHLIYFYPKSQMKPNISAVKKSLSKTLSFFHPLAGRVSEDVVFVNCKDDEGAAYVEAEVTDFSLEEFMSKLPNAHLLRQLVPQHDPFALSGRALTVQVTVFKCGGIALAIGTLHAIVDGTTSFCFKKAWAAIARDHGSSEHFLAPSFVPTTSFFPPNSSLQKDRRFLWVDLLIEPVNSNCVTRRFVFDSSGVSRLREKASSEMLVQRPSRFEAVSALIWGRATEALRKSNGVKRPSVFSTAVDLRRRMTPPLPTEAFGNLIWPAIAVCEADENVELQRLVGLIREATKKIDAKFIDKIRNRFNEAYQELCASYATNEGVGNTDFFSSSSLMNMGMYELDFGFGNPKWVSFGITDSPHLRNSFYCMETKSGEALELWVTLKEEEMAVLEKDHVLLSFSSLDPSPF